MDPSESLSLLKLTCQLGLRLYKGVIGFFFRHALGEVGLNFLIIIIKCFVIICRVFLAKTQTKNRCKGYHYITLLINLGFVVVFWCIIGIKC